MNVKTIRLIITFSALSFVAGCGVEKNSSKSVVVPSDKEMTLAIAEQARDFDKQVIDGFFFGTEPRIFKSGYGKSSAEQKANFSVDYHNWLNKSGQNMAAKWESYVPYSQRSEFARQWWAKDAEFIKATPKYKVVWIHEALLDGGELWWRAYEKSVGAEAAATDVLYHDKEQSMVSSWSESENQPGSLSTQAMPK